MWVVNLAPSLYSPLTSLPRTTTLATWVASTLSMNSVKVGSCSRGPMPVLTIFQRKTMATSRTTQKRMLRSVEFTLGLPLLISEPHYLRARGLPFAFFRRAAGRRAPPPSGLNVPR